ncbi:YdeI/OmpD-associated family protein [Candidatus Peribacteria bacterium]|nr:YdeI/OmpD-associated family protein [Candidatus Peribacteria bacterium]
MSNTHVANGIVHNVPDDMKKVLLSQSELLINWNNLTEIARNEWICWVTIVKKDETRKEHIERMREDLLNGKKRPCCWPGCPHHNPKAKKWFK